MRAARCRRPHDPGNGGGGCFIVGGHFALTGGQAGILLGVLPPIVHIREEADRAALRWSLERMRQELKESQPGGLLVAQHLAVMILVQALRLHLAEAGGVGWLFALADRQMAAAIGAIHDDPAHGWTVEALAERAGMSRSSFAQKFKANRRPIADGVPHRVAHAAGRRSTGPLRRARLVPSPPRSATSPKAPSAPPSSASWAARRGGKSVHLSLREGGQVQTFAYIHPAMSDDLPSPARP